MKITRKQIRDLIIEMYGGMLRQNKRNDTNWEAWLEEIDDDEAEIIDGEDEETISKSQ